MKKLPLALALFLPFAAAACGDDEDPIGLCSTDADCANEATNTVCDFRTGACVAGCDEAADCGGSLPTCNVPAVNPTPNTEAPAVCICETGSCPTGQNCLPDGSCGTPGPGTGCGTPGEQGSCSVGEICLPDGTCAEQCSNGDGTDGCLAMDMLCDTTSTTSATFNQCVMPQIVTGDCPNTQSHTRDTDGPIVVTVEPTGDLGSTANCTASVQQFSADVYAPDGLPNSLFSQGISRLNPNGNSGFVFSDGDGTPTHPMIMTNPPNSFTVTFTLCLGPADMAQQLGVFVTDSDGDDSNGFCFRADP